MCVAPRGIAAHENWPNLGGLLGANSTFSRFLGARRAATQGWGPVRRLFYGLITPVSSPVLGMWRLFMSLRGRRSLLGPVLAAVPVDLLSHLWSGAGEAMGYLWGEGDSHRALFDCELGRARSTVE